MFIAVDGVDGAGKSTLVQGLAAALRAQSPLLTKEPTDRSKWGRKLRLAAVHGRLPREIETKYFHLDRLVHIRDVIRPALQSAMWVISDRYVDSTLAFQADTPEQANELYDKFLPDIIIPDLTFILDCPVIIGLDRIKRGRASLSAFEKPAILERAQIIYASRNGDNYVHLDATKRISEVLADALKILEERLRATTPNYNGTSCVGALRMATGS